VIWQDILTALGLVAVFEGLALALAPSRLDEVLALLARMPVETRRTLGLTAIALGVAIVWLARS
jgi:uncharacterized protein YjeT (DUF2065 family)